MCTSAPPTTPDHDGLAAGRPIAPGLDVTHQLVDVPDGQVHVVTQGTGPLVLLVHGFPESWRSWRHQIPDIASAGFRAAAVDVRGYGRSSVPAAVDAYRVTDLVDDLVAVIEALHERAAVVVGHDVGSVIAADAALLRPDVFRAVGLLGVPYAPRGGPRPSEAFAQMGGAEEFYVSYFQEPGRAEAEIEVNVRDWLAGFYTALAGQTRDSASDGVFFVPPGGRMSDRFPRGDRPSWLSDADLDLHAAELARTGLTGALNRYRNMDRDWEDLAAYDGAPIEQPSLFVAGGLDSTTNWMKAVIAAHDVTLPGLVSSHVLEGAGHWLQHERPSEISRLLTEWLTALPESGR